MPALAMRRKSLQTWWIWGLSPTLHLSWIPHSHSQMGVVTPKHYDKIFMLISEGRRDARQTLLAAESQAT